MDTTESITFTSKLTFWDKFKCFYLLNLYNLIYLYNVKKWQRILGHLIYIYIWIVLPVIIFWDTDLGLRLFDVFCLLSFFWVPAITSFKVARNVPDNVQLILTPENATEAPKVRYSDIQIDSFKDAILFDTTNFYIVICRVNAVNKLIYSIISKKQNKDVLTKFDFVKTIYPDFKKTIKLHI